MKRRGKIQVQPADALSVSCPDCGAVAGERCVDGWGAKAPTHPIRIAEVNKWSLRQLDMFPIQESLAI